MRDRYEKLLDLAVRHRESVVRGDFEQGDQILMEQEALVQTMPGAEELSRLVQREKHEVLGLLRAIQDVYEDTRRKLEEQVRARVREITALLEERRALAAYGDVVASQTRNFDRRK